MYSAVEVGGPAARRAVRRYGATDDPRLLRPLPGRVGGRRCGRPSAGSPTASTRVRTGSTTTATRIGRVPVRVTVTVRGDRAAFDFTGTGPAVKGPVNATPFVTCSAVYYSVKSLVAPDVPAQRRRATVPSRSQIPPDTILNPPLGAPVVGRQSRDVPAGRGRLLQGARSGRFPSASPPAAPPPPASSSSAARQDGRWRILYEVHGGGEGAGAARDGGHAVRVHMSNVMNTPIEVVETEYPIEILHHALRPGSGGAGAHRGGCGFTRAYRVLGRRHADDHARAPRRPAVGRVRRRRPGRPTASRSSATGPRATSRARRRCASGPATSW